MDTFATRSALVAIWLTFAAFGLMLLGTGVANLYGSTIVHSNTGGEGFAGTAIGAMVAMGIVLTLTGLAATVFCGLKIRKAVTKPMTSGDNARAKTPLGRTLAAMAFAGGTLLGLYGFYHLGAPLNADIAEHRRTTNGMAKLIAIDENPDTDGRFGVTFQMLGQDAAHEPIRFYIPGKDYRIAPKLGQIKELRFDKTNPADYKFGHKSSLAYFFPQFLPFTFLFYLVAAGVTGVRLNVSEEEDDQDGASAYAGGCSPQASRQYGQPQRFQGGGQAGGSGKFF